MNIPSTKRQIMTREDIFNHQTLVASASINCLYLKWADGFRSRVWQSDLGKIVNITDHKCYDDNHTRVTDGYSFIVVANRLLKECK